MASTYRTVPPGTHEQWILALCCAAALTGYITGGVTTALSGDLPLNR
jgi:hypothetical protein